MWIRFFPPDAFLPTHLNFTHFSAPPLLDCAVSDLITMMKPLKIDNGAGKILTKLKWVELGFQQKQRYNVSTAACWVHNVAFAKE